MRIGKGTIDAEGISAYVDSRKGIHARIVRSSHTGIFRSRKDEHVFFARNDTVDRSDFTLRRAGISGRSDRTIIRPSDRKFRLIDRNGMRPIHRNKIVGGRSDRRHDCVISTVPLRSATFDRRAAVGGSSKRFSRRVDIIQARNCDRRFIRRVVLRNIRSRYLNFVTTAIIGRNDVLHRHGRTIDQRFVDCERVIFSRIQCVVVCGSTGKACRHVVSGNRIGNDQNVRSLCRQSVDRSGIRSKDKNDRIAGKDATVDHRSNRMFRCIVRKYGVGRAPSNAKRIRIDRPGRAKRSAFTELVVGIRNG